MVFENIEKLKCEYTDKYVIVDETRPELRRFGGQTGTVRTVNMSGRALVEFDAYDNIGWFDIDVDFLKIIERPLEKKEEPKSAAKPAADAKPKSAAKKPAAMSPADILAAARGGAATSPKPDASKPATGSPATGNPTTGKMSAADILAAARGGAAPAAKKPAAKSPAAPKPAAPKPAAPKIDDDIEVEEEAIADEAVIETVKAAAPTTQPAAQLSASGPLPTAIADILAFCRARDSA